MFDNVKKDIKRYIATEEVKGIRSLVNLYLFNYSLWALMSYRFGRWARNDVRIPVVRLVLKIISKICHEILSLLTGIYITFDVNIGPGLYIGHTGMLVISSNAIIQIVTIRNI